MAHRGYHAYMSLWERKIDEMYALKPEPKNKEDSNTVARVTRSGRGKTASKPYSHSNEMMDDYEVIRHIPKLMALWLTKF